jgi:deazaflavin-dependent oxidoreductase (nitroreductase family)
MATQIAASRAGWHSGRRFLGLRRAPGRLALWVFRLPLALYRRGWGWVFGRTFLMFVHVGRTTGRLHQAVAMVLGDDPLTRELVICSAWGQDAQWIRNLRAAPATEIRIGRDRFVATQRFLADDEAVAAAHSFRQRHPYRLRLIGTILGWADLSSDHAMRRFVRTHPFVAFRPADSEPWTSGMEIVR